MKLNLLSYLKLNVNTNLSKDIKKYILNSFFIIIYYYNEK